MPGRMPGSMQTRHDLSDPIEGRLSSQEGRSRLAGLAIRLIIEEALEAEARDATGRECHEHGVEPGQGHGNGNRTARPKTAQGAIEYGTPRPAGRDAPFRPDAFRTEGQHRTPRELGGGDAGQLHLLSGHAHPQPRRTSAGCLRRRRRHHQGDRDPLSPFRTSEVPCTPDAQPRLQGSREPVAGVRGHGSIGPAGTVTGACPQCGRGTRRQIRKVASGCAHCEHNCITLNST